MKASVGIETLSDIKVLLEHLEETWLEDRNSYQDDTEVHCRGCHVVRESVYNREEKCYVQLSFLEFEHKAGCSLREAHRRMTAFVAVEEKLNEENVHG